ncbi:hypothetical protein BGW42_007158 [Actinomortierella wolfii]|nr:hypothetical protein BGW42_007158 [Actinomortierella wolfii]
MKSLLHLGHLAIILSFYTQLLLLTVVSGAPDKKYKKCKPHKPGKKVDPFPPLPEGNPPLTFGAFVYPSVDILDLMGVIRVFGHKQLAQFNQTKILLVGETMDPVLSSQQVKVYPDVTFDTAPRLDYFLLPGARAAEQVIANQELMKRIVERVDESRWCLTVCTGAAILAATGRMDGRYMTTNKVAWNKYIDFGPKVKWVKRARWVQDGKYVSSSGVSAGIDMAFFVVSELYGEKFATQFANWIEYTRHTDANDDPFSDLYPDNRDCPSTRVPTPTPTP